MTNLTSTFASPRQSPGFMLWQVTQAWQRAIRAALAAHDLTHVQFVLLAVLTSHDGDALTQRELARAAGTDPMMTSQVIRALASKGLVDRRAHPGDGRAVIVDVTTAGRERANEANGSVEGADEQFFGALGDSAHRLTALLAALAHEHSRDER